MSYREHATDVPEMVLWERVVDPGSERLLILPDGCLDLIWDGYRLFVAGPDSSARWTESRSATSYTGVRFSGGIGPALLGVRADELLDISPDLDALWPSCRVRELVERIGSDPAVALKRWSVLRYNAASVDPLARRIFAMSRDGVAASVMAERSGLNARQLHRRCLSLFGYGPRHLGRVLRLQRAMMTARSGASLAQVAAGCGYADQPHLCKEIRVLAGTTPTGLLQHLSRRELSE